MDKTGMHPLLVIGFGFILLSLVFLGRAISNSKSNKVEQEHPICQEKEVVGAYVIQNGGSPYYQVVYKDDSTENILRGVPYIGQKKKICK